MHWICNLPAASILLPMFCAILSSVLKGPLARRLSLALCVLVGALSALVFGYVMETGEAFTYMMGHFPSPWGNELRAGVLEALLGILFSVVMFLSISGGLEHIRRDIEPTKENLYFIMLDLLLGALMAMLYTNDLFTAYVFVEITTIASCGLLMIRQIGRTTLAATRYMIMSLLGSGMLLIGIALLYDMTGHLLMTPIQASIAAIVAQGQFHIPLLVTLSLICLGLAIKSGLFPFHAWMPDTYGFATPTSGAVLSGLVSKGYIFLLLKILYRVIGMNVVRSSQILNVLFVFALCGIIFGSLSAIRENDIRRMIAFSSAAQIGYIYMGFGLGTTAGVAAAVFHIIAHAATKALLFTCAAGLSDVSGGSKVFADLQGAGRRNPIAGFAFTVGALSMVGLPMLAGFVSKLLFAVASVQSVDKMLPTLIVLAVSTILNAVYFLRTVVRIYRPTLPEAERTKGLPAFTTRGWREQKAFAAVMLCFVLLNLLLGIGSTPITSAIERGLSMFA